MGAQDPKPDDKGVAAAEVISKKRTVAGAAAAMNRKFPNATKKITAAEVKRWVAALRKKFASI